MLAIRLLIIFPSSSIWKSKSSGILKSPSSAQISKIASVSAKEPFEILRKLIKSFAVLRFFPSAIFNETETTALLSCCLRLYSSDFGNLEWSWGRSGVGDVHKIITLFREG